MVIQAAIGGQVYNNWVRQTRNVVYDAPAGMVWDGFVEMTCRQGYTGVECMAGIPGLVGGTPVQNVGAYGQEVSQTITSVRVLDLKSLEFCNLAAADCGFAYRSSIFNTTRRGRYVVTRVRFEFDSSGVPNLTYPDLLKHFAGQPEPKPKQICEAVRAIRHSKGMLLVEGDPDARSAGSFFKNPVVDAEMVASLAAVAGCGLDEVPRFPGGAAGMVKVPAAWLMERAGFCKGFAMGRAGLSSKHVLAIVNRGGTTAAEIVALRDAVVGAVQARFGITLEQEPVMLGFSVG
jgi:UDP-N-acetylmuramate dehydrogenase